MKNSIVLCLLGVALSFAQTGHSAPLTEARVTKIINDVKIIDPSAVAHPARLDDVIKGDLGLKTGIKSRSELLFQDDTLTRIGPESYFSFKPGTRDMVLERGTMLLQVPKNIGGAKIHSGAITASITGTTIMMEHIPNRSLKVLVLEGSLRLSIDGKIGDSLLLLPGRMIIMPPKATRIPDPVTVDLKKIVSTSGLVKMRGKKDAAATPLPSLKLIEKEINKQEAERAANELVDTNLVIAGKGTKVLLGSDELLDNLARHSDATPPSRASLPEPTPNPTPNINPTPNPNPPPSGTPPPPPPGLYTTDSTTTITTRNNALTIVTQGVTQSGVAYKDLQTNGSPAGFLFGGPSAFDNEFGFDTFYLQNFGQSAVYTFDSLQLGGGLTFVTSDGANRVALIGNNGITNSAAGVIQLGGIDKLLFGTRSGNITLDSGISFAGTGEKPSLLQFYARNGDLSIGSTFTLPNTTFRFGAENNALLDSGVAIIGKNLTMTGLQTARFDGNANLSSLFQLNGGDVALGGTVTAKTGFLYGSSATVNGTFAGENLTANVTGNFSLGGSVSLHGTSLLQINAGGTATIAGTVGGNLTINAHDIVFGIDMAFAPNAKVELTASGGNIDATGHSLSGFDQISLDVGNLIAGSLMAKTLLVGGILGGGSINAETITTNGLHVDNVTATKTLTINSPDLAPYSGNTISINTPSLLLVAGATLDGANGTLVLPPGNASNLSITTVNLTLGTNISLNGGDGDINVSDAGGSGGQLSVITSNSLTVNAPISATTGQNSTSGMTGGDGGTVNLSTSGTVTLNNRIEVSSNDGNRRRSATGGNITVTSTKTSGTAISVGSSAQLLALLDAAAPGPGGSIKFISAGGDINISGTAQADRGTVQVDNNGTSGKVNLTNAMLHGDVIKIGALGSNGTLNIGGGTIDADSVIKLYAGSSNGTINFTNNVTLSGNSVKTIAANTVTIFNGKMVTILGPAPANVFTQHPNYMGSGGNGTTTGTFGGQGAVTSSSSPPGY